MQKHSGILSLVICRIIFSVDLIHSLWKKKKLLFCSCTLKERNISFAFKQKSLRMYAGTSITQLHNWCVHFSFFHFQQKAHQSCGDVWYSWWEEVSVPLGAESRELKSKRGQRAWERIGIIFSTRTFFGSPGITGNLWEEVYIWNMIHESEEMQRSANIRLPHSHVVDPCLHLDFIILMHLYFRLIMYSFGPLGGNREMVTSPLCFALCACFCWPSDCAHCGLFFSELFWWYTALCGNPVCRDSFISLHRLQASIFIKLNNCCLEKKRPLLSTLRVADLG